MAPCLACTLPCLLLLYTEHSTDQAILEGSKTEAKVLQNLTADGPYCGYIRVASTWPARPPVRPLSPARSHSPSGPPADAGAGPAKAPPRLQARQRPMSAQGRQHHTLAGPARGPRCSQPCLGKPPAVSLTSEALCAVKSSAQGRTAAVRWSAQAGSAEGGGRRYISDSCVLWGCLSALPCNLWSTGCRVEQVRLQKKQRRRSSLLEPCF